MEWDQQGVRKAMSAYAEENYSDMLKRCPDSLRAEELLTFPIEVIAWYIMHVPIRTLGIWANYKPLIELMQNVLKGVAQEEATGRNNELRG